MPPTITTQLHALSPNVEVSFGTITNIAGFDFIDVFVDGSQNPDVLAEWRLYEKVGGLTTLVATAPGGGPQASVLAWQVGGNGIPVRTAGVAPFSPAEGSGFTFELRAFLSEPVLTSGPPPNFTASLIGYDEFDVAANSDNGATVIIPPNFSEITLGVALGYAQFADCVVSQSFNVPIQFTLYARAGVGGVIAEVARVTLQSSDGNARIFGSPVRLPGATDYQLRAKFDSNLLQTAPTGPVSVTGGLATHSQSVAVGGVVNLTGNVNGPSNANRWTSLLIPMHNASVVIPEVGPVPGDGWWFVGIQSLAGPAQVLLPANPTGGEVVVVTDENGLLATPVSVNGNGHLVEGVPVFALNVAYPGLHGSVCFQFDIDTVTGIGAWYIFADYAPNATRPPVGPGLPGQRLTTNDAPAAVWEYPPLVNVKDVGLVGNGIADDSAAFQAILNLLAGTGIGLFFPTGTFLINSTVTMPSGTRIDGSPNAVLLGDIGGLFPLAGSILRSGISGGPAGVTTVAAPGVVKGSRTVPVTSTVGATVGGFTFISNPITGNRQTYRNEAIGAGSITVDRPILVAAPFVAGNNVTYYNANQIPQNIVINGNGMKVRGKAVVTISLQTSWNCKVDSLVFDEGTPTNPSDACFGFNNACYNCLATNLYADMTGGGAPSVIFAPESSESCEFYDCTAIGGANAGMGFINSYDCIFVGCHVENCLGGYEWTNDINPANGSDYCACIGCYAIGCGSIGFDIGDNSTDASCVDCNASYCGSGFQIEAGTQRATISGKAIGNAASALIVIGTAKFTQVPLLEIADNAGIALNIADDCTIGTLSGSGKATVGAALLLMSGGVVSIDELDVSRRVGGTAAFLFTVNAGRLSLGRGQILCGTTGDVCLTTNAGVLLTGCVQCKAVDAAIATFGTFVPGGTVRIQDGFDADGCATSALAVPPGVTNRLQVVANGIVPVPVAWVDLKATDRVGLTLRTPNPAAPVLLGTPSVTYTPGVGFTVTGTQVLDASTYDYVVG